MGYRILRVHGPTSLVYNSDNWSTRVTSVSKLVMSITPPEDAGFKKDTFPNVDRSLRRELQMNGPYSKCAAPWSDMLG